MNRFLLLPCATIAIALVLSACGPSPDTDTPAADAAFPLDQPEEAMPPATASDAGPHPGAAQMPAEGVIGFEGFGPAAFGDDQEAVRMAWGRDLGDARPDERGGCYYLRPQPEPEQGERIGFMIEGDRFVRIDVAAADIQAPGGGHVGMHADDVRALYGDRIEELRHKYLDEGRYLRIADPGGGDGVLLFEAGEDGLVTGWRIGVEPQVDYVERCG